MPTISFQSFIADLPTSAPEEDIHIYSTLEEYEAGMDAVAKDETLSGSEKAEILATTLVPEETYEEYMKRHDD